MGPQFNGGGPSPLAFFFLVKNSFKGWMFTLAEVAHFSFALLPCVWKPGFFHPRILLNRNAPDGFIDQKLKEQG